MPLPIVDVHCHYFNVQYVVRELLEMQHEKALGVYPAFDYFDDDTTPQPQSIRSFGVSLKKGFEIFLQAMKLGLRSPEANFRYAKDCLAKGELAGYPLLSCPLMMDIYYAGANARWQFPVPMPEPELVSTETYLAEARWLESELLSSYRVAQRAQGLSFEGEADLRASMREVIEEGADHIASRSRPSTGPLALSPLWPTNSYLSKGYKHHMEELLRLQGESFDEVFPFFAFDPRRPGILDAAKLLVGQGRPFRGIKLYPPLGYLPTHPGLYPLYAWASEQRIPITIHTSPGPVRTFASKLYVPDLREGVYYETLENFEGRDASWYFSDPARWKPILENPDWPDLRLNFAHLGGYVEALQYARRLESTGQPDPASWTEQIIQFVEKYPGRVFTDFSYFPRDESLEALWTLLRARPNLERGLMFGTDFVMLIFEGKQGNLEDYYNRYAGLPDTVLRANALEFLGLTETAPMLLFEGAKTKGQGASL